MLLPDYAHQAREDARTMATTMPIKSVRGRRRTLPHGVGRQVSVRATTRLPAGISVMGGQA